MAVQDRWTDTYDPEKGLRMNLRAQWDVKFIRFFERRVSNQSLTISPVKRGLLEFLDAV